MIEFLSVFHIIITVALCGLVLIQDSKGGGALGIGGSGSNSLLGATGAQSLAATMTRWVAILFAGSCIGLTYALAHQHKSVVENAPASSVPAATPIPENSPTTAVGTEPAKPAEMKAEPAAATATAPAAQTAPTPQSAPPEKK